MCVKSDCTTVPADASVQRDLSAWTFCCAPLLNRRGRRPQLRVCKLSRLLTLQRFEGSVLASSPGLTSTVPDLFPHSPSKASFESAMLRSTFGFAWPTVHPPGNAWPFSHSSRLWLPRTSLVFSVFDNFLNLLTCMSVTIFGAPCGATFMAWIESCRRRYFLNCRWLGVLIVANQRRNNCGCQPESAKRRKRCSRQDSNAARRCRISANLSTESNVRDVDGEEAVTDENYRGKP